MKDSEAKEILSRWPDVAHGDWHRLKSVDEKNTPYLFVPGSRSFSINPDGLYGRFVCDEHCYLEYVDILAIEVCSSRQNLYDKRSRYAEQNPLGIYCQPSWLENAKYLSHIGDKGLQNIPVRCRAVLFAISSAEFELAKRDIAPWGNEYYVSFEKLHLASEAFLEMARPNARFICHEGNEKHGR
jgi:hypothetical protein